MTHETGSIRTAKAAETQVQMNTVVIDEDLKEEDGYGYGYGYGSTTLNPGKKDLWISSEIQLQDIDIVHEQFAIVAWFNFLWRDPNNELMHFLDKEQQESILDITQDYLKIEDLSYIAKRMLPVTNLYTFIENVVDIEFQAQSIGKFGDTAAEKKNGNVWIMILGFNAKCNEKLELGDFPFDGQFLNLKFKYNVDQYKFSVSEDNKCPKWLYDTGLKHCGTFYLNRLLQVDVRDSVKSSWRVLSPWMDLRKRTSGAQHSTPAVSKQLSHAQTVEKLDSMSAYQPLRIENESEFVFRFSLIRLRVIRYPGFYLYNGVLPLMLVVLCAFGVFSLDSRAFLGDKLSYVVTLLLTVSAFQYSLTVDLPQTSETTMIDTYVLVAYCILAIMVAEIAVVSLINDEDLASALDLIVGVLCAFTWLCFSMRFVIRYIQYKRNTHIDWHKLSIKEMRVWHRGEKDSKFETVQPGNLFV